MIFKYNLFGFDKDGYNRQGFDKMGYDRDGFDAQGYDRSGYNKKGFHKLTGLDRDGYDADGFNTSGYNRAGFDRNGFSSEGIDCDGFDRDGYDRNGYNRSGFNRDGYDINGYDRFGFDHAGYDKNGFDHTGYNQNGFDRSGFDRNGFDAYGYDKNGLDKNGYDIDGFDLSGFSKDGFDRTGFNKNGYDRNGFDIFGIDADGYNQAGFDSNGYDRNGFDKAGFDKNGYDRNGFNNEGFNKQGYDRNGFDRDGFDCNGRDSDGYDKLGYDVTGFNRKGYDCNGYDRHGYDLNGRDKDGYDINGFDPTGYDRQGFNADGKTDTGFDRSEFDADGFHILTGYNPFGFDHDGFNINGINADGYDRDGFHVETGLNKDGYDRNGFDAQGYDRSGYNRKGRNKNGRTRQEEEHAKLMTVVWVDRKGNREIAKQSDKITTWKQRDANGFTFDGYDIDGFDHDGFNRKGFNRKGIHKETGTHYNRAGFDAAGFDQNGFNATGYNAAGFDHQGYNYAGFNVAGFDRHGFDRNGYNINGVDRKGFTRDHVCAETGTPFDSDGYDYQGYDRNGYNKEQIHRDGYHISASHLEKEDRHERVHFDRVEESSSQKMRILQNEIKQHELTAPLNAFESNYEDFDPYEYAKNMNVYRQTESKLETDLKVWRNICSQPFFARIDWNKQKGVYIGKHEIPGEVIDWADRVCSLYYDYQMYIGNQDYGLELVRDFDIENGIYHGFNDKYAASAAEQESSSPSVDMITDKRLLAVINTYKAEKRIHDIIATIQKNQYAIITNNPSANIIVNGCAGSGKTMIMFHRLRYLLYNFADIKPENTFLISPFGILNGESDELSEALQLQKTNRLSVDQFYIYIINSYRDVQKEDRIDFNALRLVSNSQVSNNILQRVYSSKCVESYQGIINRLFLQKVPAEMGTFISSECEFLKGKLAVLNIQAETGIDGLTAAIENFKKSKNSGMTIEKNYSNALNELKGLSLENGLAMQKAERQKLQDIKNDLRILDELLTQGRFCGSTRKIVKATFHGQSQSKTNTTDNKADEKNSKPVDDINEIINTRRLYNVWNRGTLCDITTYHSPFEFFDKFADESDFSNYCSKTNKLDVSFFNNAYKIYASALSELSGLSRENGLAMQNMELLKLKDTENSLTILSDLLSQKRFCGSTKVEKISKTENRISNSVKLSSVKKLYEKWNAGVFGSAIYHNPFEFFDEFDSICEQVDALKKYVIIIL